MLKSAIYTFLRVIFDFVEDEKPSSGKLCSIFSLISFPELCKLMEFVASEIVGDTFEHIFPTLVTMTSAPTTTTTAFSQLTHWLETWQKDRETLYSSLMHVLPPLPKRTAHVPSKNCDYFVEFERTNLHVMWLSSLQLVTKSINSNCCWRSAFLQSLNQMYFLVNHSLNIRREMQKEFQEFTAKLGLLGEFYADHSRLKDIIL
jgi:hypothetical protein